MCASSSHASPPASLAPRTSPKSPGRALKRFKAGSAFIGDSGDRPCGQVGCLHDLAHWAPLKVETQIAATVGPDKAGVCAGVRVADDDERPPQLVRVASCGLKASYSFGEPRRDRGADPGYVDGTWLMTETPRKTLAARRC